MLSVHFSCLSYLIQQHVQKFCLLSFQSNIHNDSQLLSIDSSVWFSGETCNKFFLLLTSMEKELKRKLLIKQQLTICICFVSKMQLSNQESLLLSLSYYNPNIAASSSCLGYGKQTKVPTCVPCIKQQSCVSVLINLTNGLIGWWPDEIFTFVHIWLSLRIILNVRNGGKFAMNSWRSLTHLSTMFCWVNF